VANRTRLDAYAALGRYLGDGRERSRARGFTRVWEARWVV